MADEAKLADALIASMPVLRPAGCVGTEAVLRWLLAEAHWTIWKLSQDDGGDYDCEMCR